MTPMAIQRINEIFVTALQISSTFVFDFESNLFLFHNTRYLHISLFVIWNLFWISFPCRWLWRASLFVEFKFKRLIVIEFSYLFFTFIETTKGIHVHFSHYPIIQAFNFILTFLPKKNTGYEINMNMRNHHNIFDENVLRWCSSILHTLLRGD
jgi:hypothetical protein